MGRRRRRYPGAVAVALVGGDVGDLPLVVFAMAAVRVVEFVVRMKAMRQYQY